MDIVIDRPDRRNALSVAMLEAMREAVMHGRNARVLLVRGGNDCFSAGADLREATRPDYPGRLQQLLETIDAVPVPTIAWIGGPALGAGAQLAVHCDLRMVAPNARIAVPAARRGMAIWTASASRLSQLVGPSVAADLLLGGAELDAIQARQCGFASRLGDDTAARQWAREIAGFSALSLRYHKAALRARESTRSGRKLARLAALVRANDDAAERTSAFLGRRVL